MYIFVSTFIKESRLNNDNNNVTILSLIETRPIQLLFQPGQIFFSASLLIFAIEKAHHVSAGGKK